MNDDEYDDGNDDAVADAHTADDSDSDDDDDDEANAAAVVVGWMVPGAKPVGAS